MCFVVFVSKLYRYNNVILLTKNISTIEIYDIWKLQLLPNKTRRTREKEIETPKIMNWNILITKDNINKNKTKK